MLSWSPADSDMHIACVTHRMHTPRDKFPSLKWIPVWAECIVILRLNCCHSTNCLCNLSQDQTQTLVLDPDSIVLFHISIVHLLVPER